MPALQNPPLITIHVGLAVISYGIFATSFAAGVGVPRPGHRRTGSRWLPSHKVLDEVAYRAVIIGFPIFATMIILGLVVGLDRLVALLGLGPEGDRGAHHVAVLRGLPPRPEPEVVGRPARGAAARRRVRDGDRHVLGLALVQRPALVQRAVTGPRPARGRRAAGPGYRCLTWPPAKTHRYRAPRRSARRRSCRSSRCFVAALALRPQLLAIGPLLPAIWADLGIAHAAAGLLGGSRSCAWGSSHRRVPVSWPASGRAPPSPCPSPASRCSGCCDRPRPDATTILLATTAIGISVAAPGDPGDLREAALGRTAPSWAPAPTPAGSSPARRSRPRSPSRWPAPTATGGSRLAVISVASSCRSSSGWPSSARTGPRSEPARRPRASPGGARPRGFSSSCSPSSRCSTTARRVAPQHVRRARLGRGERGRPCWR